MRRLCRCGWAQGCGTDRASTLATLPCSTASRRPSLAQTLCIHVSRRAPTLSCTSAHALIIETLQQCTQHQRTQCVLVGQSHSAEPHIQCGATRRPLLNNPCCSTVSVRPRAAHRRALRPAPTSAPGQGAPERSSPSVKRESVASPVPPRENTLSRRLLQRPSLAVARRDVNRYGSPAEANGARRPQPLTHNRRPSSPGLPLPPPAPRARPSAAAHVAYLVVLTARLQAHAGVVRQVAGRHGRLAARVAQPRLQAPQRRVVKRLEVQLRLARLVGLQLRLAHRLHGHIDTHRRLLDAAT
jgi:hypothetical protein